jgi:hypothetical protein
VLQQFNVASPATGTAEARELKGAARMNSTW